MFSSTSTWPSGLLNLVFLWIKGNEIKRRCHSSIQQRQYKTVIHNSFAASGECWRRSCIEIQYISWSTQMNTLFPYNWFNKVLNESNKNPLAIKTDSYKNSKAKPAKKSCADPFNETVAKQQREEIQILNEFGHLLVRRRKCNKK